MTHSAAVRHPRRISIALLAVALLACAVPGSAQTVRGRLTEQGSGAPVAGALVTLVDTDGRAVRTAASDGEGRFRAAAPGAGTYGVRVERVGHATVFAAPMTLAAGEERELPLAIAADPVTLEAVSVTAGGRCAASPQRQDGEALARVWDEARKALALTVASAHDPRLAYRFNVYERGRSPRLDRVLFENVETRVGAVSRPFAGVAAEELAERGWVRRDASGRLTFYGPDAEVLLSDVFLARHCFRLVEGSGAEAGMVGLAFEPLSSRRHMDVRGVLWLRRSTAELSHLTFEFVGVEVPSGDPSRGRVDFVRMPSGAWIVRGWEMRIPVASPRFSHDQSATTARLGNPQWWKETGGTVVDAGLAALDEAAP